MSTLVNEPYDHYPRNIDENDDEDDDEDDDETKKMIMIMRFKVVIIVVILFHFIFIFLLLTSYHIHIKLTHICNSIQSVDSIIKRIMQGIQWHKHGLQRSFYIVSYLL